PGADHRRHPGADDAPVRRVHGEGAVLPGGAQGGRTRQLVADGSGHGSGATRSGPGVADVRPPARDAGGGGEGGAGAVSGFAQQVLLRRDLSGVDRTAGGDPGGVLPERGHERGGSGRGFGGAGAAADRGAVPAGAERAGAVLRAGDDPGSDGIFAVAGEVAVTPSPPGPSPTRGRGGDRKKPEAPARVLVFCLSPPRPSLGEGAGG